jgi:hypothetical protein
MEDDHVDRTGRNQLEGPFSRPGGKTERTIPGDLQDVLRKPPCDLYRRGEDFVLVLSEIVSLPTTTR